MIGIDEKATYIPYEQCLERGLSFSWQSSRCILCMVGSFGGHDGDVHHGHEEHHGDGGQSWHIAIYKRRLEDDLCSP